MLIYIAYLLEKEINCSAVRTSTQKGLRLLVTTSSPKELRYILKYFLI